MAKYTSCECGNEEIGATIYQCKSCGRVGCSNCANPETSDGEWEIGTCFCGADKDEYDDGRLFAVLGHIEEDDAGDEDGGDDDDVGNDGDDE